MKLVGFGCSFTYGSELMDPELEDDYDRHYDNIPYREKHCWLGQLAEMLDCSFDNRASPASSNYSIQEEFADWFDGRLPDSNDVICIGWTNHLRTSWWSDDDQRWVHDGFIRNEDEKLFRASFREWLALSYERNATITNHAKLFVNSVCQVNNIKIIQFNALNNIPTPYKFPNYHQGDQNMQDVLRKENINLEKNFLAPGEHPNEAGHKHYAKMLHSWAEAKKIL
jgi:hypothetical protein